MRNIKEILEIMLQHEELFLTGLCNWACNLKVHGHINYEELMRLYKYIQDNRPAKWSGIITLICMNNLHYWPVGWIIPRRKWLKHHIKLNS